MLFFLQLLFGIINICLVISIVINKPKNWDYSVWLFIYFVVFMEFEFFVFFE